MISKVKKNETEFNGKMVNEKSLLIRVILVASLVMPVSIQALSV
jgi:hypothetical protein